MLDLIRLIIYTWGLYEVGTLTSLYYLANKGMVRKDPFVLNTLVLCASILFMVITLMVMNITSIFLPHLAVVLRNAIVLPIIAIAFSARCLKRKYI